MQDALSDPHQRLIARVSDVVGSLAETPVEETEALRLKYGDDVRMRFVVPTSTSLPLLAKRVAAVFPHLHVGISHSAIGDADLLTVDVPSRSGFAERYAGGPVARLARVGLRGVATLSCLLAVLLVVRL